MNQGNLEHKDSITIKCPSCRKEHQLLTGYQATEYACTCGKIVSVSPDSVKVIGELNRTKAPVIPIGTKGTFNGKVFKVIGYTRNKEVNSSYFWSEYVLFHPVNGYAFLSEYNGHWNFLTQTLEYPKNLNKKNFELEGRSYVLFNEYYAEVYAALGEFHWDILKSKKTKQVEFISPPVILIKEAGSHELIWYKGEYISSKELKSNFQLTTRLPDRVGVSANQYSGISEDFTGKKKLAVIGLIVFTIIQFFFALTAREKEVYNQVFYMTDTTGKSSFVTEPFKLDGSLLGKSNLEFYISAPVDNSWFEAAVTLVNDETGEEFYFEEGVEYYHGYDGGSWSEGAKTETKVLSSIPDGTYHVNLNAYREMGKKIDDFHFVVTRDVSNWSNFILIFLGVLIVPVIQYFRAENFEYSRWQNSNLTP